MKLIKKLIKRTLKPLRETHEHYCGLIALKIAKNHFQSEFKQKPHNLPGLLIVSLTSYKPRFSTLLPTLECLLSQTIKPDKIILWIAHEDIEKLPENIKSLKSNGLEIRTVENFGAYKKLIPTLKEYPDAYIVTADDEVYYPPIWLEKLIEEFDQNNKKILCHRAHIITLDKDNLPLPYKNWKWDVKKVKHRERIFPTGMGGVLYPPGLLPLPETLNDNIFQKLAPDADDLWFYWMARKNGAKHMVTSYRFSHIVWPGSQRVKLSEDNTADHNGASGNDEKIRNLIKYYGFP